MILNLSWTEDRPISIPALTEHETLTAETLMYPHHRV